MHSFLHSHRLFFLIGDMRELGEQTESMHKKLAEEILDMFGHSESNIEFFLV